MKFTIEFEDSEWKSVLKNEGYKRISVSMLLTRLKLDRAGFKSVCLKKFYAYKTDEELAYLLYTVRMWYEHTKEEDRWKCYSPYCPTGCINHLVSKYGLLEQHSDKCIARLLIFENYLN